MNALPRTPIDLHKSLITYGDDLRADRMAPSFAELPEGRVQCVLGIVGFDGEESLHADQWERHPAGDETLCVLEGRLLVSIERDGATQSVVVGRGQALIVPRGAWHRLRAIEPGRLLFFTPAPGTTLRPVAGEGESPHRAIA
jgi:mannose-6-phosphate isomerase-like protein (cupin superfamily)